MGTIRWGIPMIPTLALETSAVTFVGHKWGEFRANVGVEMEKPVATNEDLLSESVFSGHHTTKTFNFLYIFRNYKARSKIMSNSICI